MRIVKTEPPNYEAIREVFPAIHGANVVFTYGDIVFNPSGGNIENHVLCHEEVHKQQQDGNPEAWWAVYLVNPEFRFGQELDAYATQYAFMEGRCKESHLARFLYAIASDLAGPIYGNMCTTVEAMAKIRNKARELFPTH